MKKGYIIILILIIIIALILNIKMGNDAVKTCINNGVNEKVCYELYN